MITYWKHKCQSNFIWLVCMVEQLISLATKICVVYHLSAFMPYVLVAWQIIYSGKIAIGLSCLFVFCLVLLLVYIYIRRKRNDYDFGLPHELMCFSGSTSLSPTPPPSSASPQPHFTGNLGYWHRLSRKFHRQHRRRTSLS